MNIGNENIGGLCQVELDQIGRELAIAEFPKNTEFIAYCAKREYPQSHAATEKLRTSGYENEKVYASGSGGMGCRWFADKIGRRGRSG